MTKVMKQKIYIIAAETTLWSKTYLNFWGKQAKCIPETPRRVSIYGLQVKAPNDSPDHQPYHCKNVGIRSEKKLTNYNVLPQPYTHTQLSLRALSICQNWPAWPFKPISLAMVQQVSSDKWKAPYDRYLWEVQCMQCLFYCLMSLLYRVK